MSEAIIQQNIFRFYHNNFCLKHHKPKHIIFSVPNESSNVKEQMYKKALGLISGVSDLIIIRENDVLFIEIKTPTGSQSPKQREFQKTVEALGFSYHLIRSLEQFKTEICQY